MNNRLKFYFAFQIAVILIVGWIIAVHVNNQLELESQSLAIIMVLNYIFTRVMLSDRIKFPYMNPIFTGIWFTIFTLTSGLHYPDGSVEYIDGFPKIGLLVIFLLVVSGIYAVIFGVEKLLKKHLSLVHNLADLSLLLVITYFWGLMVVSLR